MELDIKQAPKKRETIFVRVETELLNKIKVLERKHKADRSVVVRSLIEMGLKEVK